MRFFKLSVILLVLPYVQTVVGQQFGDRKSLKDFDYSYADCIAESFPSVQNIDPETLAASLVQGIPRESEHERFRVIFKWITENVAYKRSGQVTSQKVIRRGATKCSGYANLLEHMCRAVGIECEVIVGDCKYNWEESSIGNVLSGGHAWNAVKLYGAWQLVDATWAAGTVDDRWRFHKSYDDDFFLPDPKFLTFSHHPDEDKWQLLETPLTYSEFRDSPAMQDRQGFIESFWFEDVPDGTVHRKLQLRLTAYVPITEASFVLFPAEGTRQMEVKKLRDGTYRLKYVFKDIEYGWADLSVNGKLYMTFKKGSRNISYFPSRENYRYWERYFAALATK